MKWVLLVCLLLVAAPGEDGGWWGLMQSQGSHFPLL